MKVEHPLYAPLLESTTDQLFKVQYENWLKIKEDDEANFEKFIWHSIASYITNVLLRMAIAKNPNAKTEDEKREIMLCLLDGLYMLLEQAIKTGSESTSPSKN